MNKVEQLTNEVKLLPKDPCLQFLDIINNFPIDIFNIPRPFKSRLYDPGREISDSFCVMGAFTLLGIPHDVDYESAKTTPRGWLIGPHLLSREWTKCLSCWDYVSSGPLKECIQINPWLMVTDSCVQLAIAILRTQCETGTPISSYRAKNILKELGLSACIPVRGKGKKTNDPFLRFCDNHPVYLVTVVRLYEFIFNKFRRRYPTDYKEQIIHSFKYIFHKEIKGKLQDKIINEASYSPIELRAALAFIEYETDTPYEALKSHFYDLVENVSLTEVLHYVDEITDNSENKKKIIKEFKMQFQSEK